MAENTNYVITRLKFLEKEIERLRKYLEEPQKRKTIKLEGLWNRCFSNRRGHRRSREV